MSFLDDSISDVAIISKSKEIFSANSSMLDQAKLVWKDKSLVLKYENEPRKMNFHMVVNGEKGNLLMNNKQYKVVCGWIR